MNVFALLVATLWLQQQAPSEPWVTYRVTPDSVTVGKPFVMQMRVVAPPGSTVRFPSGPDSNAHVRLLDPVSVSEPHDSAGFLVQTATYRMAAWRPQTQDIGPGNVRVAAPQGERVLSLDAPSITVLSVLPADSAQHVPKPARQVFPAALAWWYPWLPLVILAALLAAITWWWWIRRALTSVAPGPLQFADEEFARIESLRLVYAGEPSRHVALMTDALRMFLVLRFPGVSMSQTTAELISTIPLPADDPQRARIIKLLAGAQQVQFGPPDVNTTADQAMRLGTEARDIVRSIGNPVAPLPDDEFMEDAA